jgi:hypothetical protein
MNAFSYHFQVLMCRGVNENTRRVEFGFGRSFNSLSELSIPLTLEQMTLNNVASSRAHSMSRHSPTNCNHDSPYLKSSIQIYKSLQSTHKEPTQSHRRTWTDNMYHHWLWNTNIPNIYQITPSVHLHGCCWSTLEFSSLHFPHSLGHLHGPIGRNKLQVDRPTAHPQHFPGMPRSATYMVLMGAREIFGGMKWNLLADVLANSKLFIYQ